jgi:anaerobic selenocysteine-containing dehydrogenase
LNFVRLVRHPVTVAEQENRNREGFMPEGKERRKIQTYCALCIARCGAVATVENGRFVALEPDPAHPTGQALCAKGRASPEIVYSPDRLLYPMKRTRPKTDPDPGWQRIGWDKALDTVAAAMRRIGDAHGPEAFGFMLSSPSTTALVDSVPWINRLASAFGSPNRASNHELCGWARGWATAFTWGVAGVHVGAIGAMADIANSGCVILWGYNPTMSRLTHGTALVDALKHGTKLIVIDPRHVGLASKADVWLQVRPGTDGALALGLANVMLSRGWYDHAFVRDWSNGPLLVRGDTGRFLTARDLTSDGSDRVLFGWAGNRPVAYDARSGEYVTHDEDLALDGEYRIVTRDGPVACRPAFGIWVELCGRYTPDVVRAVCRVEPEQLEQAARLIWEARPVSYYAYSGHEQHANATQTARAMSLLYLMTGCFDQMGGNVLFPAVPAAAVTGEDLPRARAMPKPAGFAARPLGLGLINAMTNNDLYDAILDNGRGRVRGLLGFGANILVGRGNVLRGREALRRLEFFASTELFMTPTAECADIVLPAASAFEREALRIGFEINEDAQSLVQLRQRVAEPRGESRGDTDIIFDLAVRLGLGGDFWGGNVGAAYRYQLERSGLTLEQLRDNPGGVRVRLRTEYGKYSARNDKGEAVGFATPTRKAEIYSETFLAHGYDPLPDWRDPLAAFGVSAEKFPLILTGAKNTLYCDSQQRNVPSLRKRAPHPEVELHPDTAAARGIAAGDWVAIETPSGSVRARARFNTSLDRDVVCGQHGWWQVCSELGLPGYDPFSEQGSNLNLVLGGAVLDPISGTPANRAHPCEVRPAV